MIQLAETRDSSSKGFGEPAVTTPARGLNRTSVQDVGSQVELDSHGLNDESRAWAEKRANGMSLLDSSAHRDELDSSVLAKCDR